MNISATELPNFIRKYYLSRELLILKYWRQNIAVFNIALHTAVKYSGVQLTEYMRQYICLLMKHHTSSLQLCGQPTVLTLTQSTTRFHGSCRSVCTATDSWRRPAEVAPDRRVRTFPPGGHRWSGQAVASTSLSLRSTLSTRWTFWAQTLGVLKCCHLHGRTPDSQLRLCLYLTLMLLSDLTKLVVAVADVDRFYWNLVTGLQLNLAVLV